MSAFAVTAFAVAGAVILMIAIDVWTAKQMRNIRRSRRAAGLDLIGDYGRRPFEYGWRPLRGNVEVAFDAFLEARRRREGLVDDGPII